MRTFVSLIDPVLDELNQTLRSVSEDEISALKNALLEAPHIFVTGKGRSGLQMRGFAMRLMHLGRMVYVIDDVTTPGIQAGDLLVIGSGSGKTPSLVQYAARAHSLGARMALLTAAKTSPLGESADTVIHITAPTPKSGTNYDKNASILPMGGLFEMSLNLVLDMVILQMMDELHLDTDQMFTRHANLE
jgi:6-phospho-3-hexuloisomerase